MLNPSRFKGTNAEQGELLPTYPSDLVPETHLARVVNEVVDTLKLDELYNKYGWEGGSTFHPKSMLKLLFYAYTQSNPSSREISQACRENYIYQYIGSGIKPDFRTISDFRKNNLDILKGLFKQIVLICRLLNLVEIGKISLDGTKIKANAGTKSVVTKDRLNKELSKIEKEIADSFAEADRIDREEDQQYGPDRDRNQVPANLQKAKDRKKEIKTILDELERLNLEKMSLTDKEASFMKSHGRFQLSYNAQCATENQVILAYDVNDQKEDSDQLVPMIEKVEKVAAELTGKSEYPLENVKLAVDSGYDSGKNLHYLEQRKIDGYIANPVERVRGNKKQGKQKQLSKKQFIYNSEGDYYQCPAGGKVILKGTCRKEKKGYRFIDKIYKGVDCQSCSLQKICVKSKTGYRIIRRTPEYEKLRQKTDEKLATEEGRLIMRHRATDIEPVFGHIKKTIMRDGSFLLRGNEKVKAEFGLICIVHNLKKIANHLKASHSGFKLPLSVKMCFQTV